MTTLRTIALCLLVLPLLGIVRAQPSDAHEGVTLPVHDYRLAPPIDEVVREVLVRPGDAVEEGDPLVLLRSGEARLQVELLTLRAESTLAIDAAKASWLLSQREEEDRRNAMESDAIREPEMRRAILKTQRDRLLYEKALQDQREIVLQRRRAQETLERYTLRAPASGIVVEVNVSAGEVPESGRAMVRVVDTSSLRLELGVPAQRASTLRVGDAAELALRIPGAPDAVLEARVTFVSPLVDVAAGGRDGAGRRMVHVEAPNPDGRPAGTLALVRFADSE